MGRLGGATGDIEPRPGGHDRGSSSRADVLSTRRWVGAAARAARRFEHLKARPTRAAVTGCSWLVSLLRSESAGLIRASRALRISHKRQLARAEVEGEVGRHQGRSRCSATCDAMERAIAGSAAEIGESRRSMTYWLFIALLAIASRRSSGSPGSCGRSRSGLAVTTSIRSDAEYVAARLTSTFRNCWSDLCRIHRPVTTCSPVAQAAIAHAQFETIHPFARWKWAGRPVH